MFAKSSVVLTVLALVFTAHAVPAPAVFRPSSSSVAHSSSAPPRSSSASASVIASASASASASAPPTVTSAGPVPLVSNAPALAAGLKGQASGNDRLKKLLTDSSGNLLTGDALRQLTVIDYNQQTPAAGAKGGSILLATVDNFPILTDLGISGAVSFVGPCGLNIPHSHPRASEILIVTEGQLNTGTVQENGFNTEIKTQLGTFQGTVFPQGSIHYQQNPTCSPAVFVAALGSEDPGRSDIATNFWMLDSDVIDAALGFPTTIGGDNIDQWRAHLPVNLAAGVDSCLQACGLSQ
ncbi:spherulin-1B precursor [Roridomyces roridus]|uniref:Spherulin-1B n=1 Tax=Roridomyces roridus TaxID=1738132 RepID=A0AAD7BSI2_9AGAR|nr:spherulin-1B precursor [Roridomyces roridus]